MSENIEKTVIFAKKEMRYPTILTIAGSDSCGGAGIQADIKTISAMGAYACSAITAITAENSKQVQSIQGVTPQILIDQINCIFEDMKIDAIKSGMLYNKKNVEAIAQILEKWDSTNYILDPVMISTSGTRLVEESAIETIQKKLFPLTTLITPNIPEAEILSDTSITNTEDMTLAGLKILKQGCKAVLIKGGHLEGNESTDVLLCQDRKEPIFFRNKSIKSSNTHGTGCTLSSAIATRLAFGDNLENAISNAKEYLHKAIEAAMNIKQTNTYGPVNHFFAPQSMKIIEN